MAEQHTEIASLESNNYTILRPFTDKFSSGCTVGAEILRNNNKMPWYLGSGPWHVHGQFVRLRTMSPALIFPLFPRP